MQRLLCLCFALSLLACKSENEHWLVGDETKFWHLYERQNVRVGDTLSIGDDALRNALFQPNYSYQFLSFRADGLLHFEELTNHSKPRKEVDKWNFEEGESALRLHPKIQDIGASEEPQLWKVERLNDSNLVISRDFSGTKAVFYYRPEKPEVPGTQKVEGPLTEASPGAQAKGLIVSKISPEDYHAKRLKLLQMHPDSMNLSYSSSQMSIGMVVEYTEEGKTVTVYADRKGNAEVYYSSGIVYSGGGAVPAIKNSAKVLGGESGRLWESMSAPEGQELPEEGKIRFYIINNRNTGEVYVDIDRARSGQEDLLRLYYHLKLLLQNYNTALGTL